ncbi:MAG: M23 family metallopeptidase, partial [Hymenobacter sp.]
TLPLLVLGQRANSLRVELPDGQRRYVATGSVAAAQPLRRFQLPVAREIQTQPTAAAPLLAAWPVHTLVAVLGESAGYTLRLWRGPGLGLFPVKGRTDQAIGSFWGNERDNGARRHEGVDIFAPRGTPAVAATDGYITRTGESKLGGRVVWLADAQGQHLYYAHLDKQLVQPGQRVRAGDTLGLVGNTGNARTTAPHLHFGIYRAGRGAVDPWPFLHRADAVPTALTSPDRRGEWVRPRTASRQLPTTLPLLVLGQRANSLRVELPDGQRRYVATGSVAAAQPLRRFQLPVAREIQTQPTAAAPLLAAWPVHTPVAVLGESAGYTLLRGPAGQQGWVKI